MSVASFFFAAVTFVAFIFVAVSLVFTFKSKCAKSQSLIDFHLSLIIWLVFIKIDFRRKISRFKIRKIHKIKFQSKLNVCTWNIRTNSFGENCAGPPFSDLWTVRLITDSSKSINSSFIARWVMKKSSSKLSGSSPSSAGVLRASKASILVFNLEERDESPPIESRRESIVGIPLRNFWRGS